MLVLTRRVGEEVCIGDDIVLKVTAIQGGRVRIGVSAPIDRRITRPEVDEKASRRLIETDSQVAELVH